MSTSQAAPEQSICYLTKRFPRLSETFILDEILGLEANGVPLRLFAIADPAEAEVQPDVAKVRSPVIYLRVGRGLPARAREYVRFARGHGRLIRRAPRRWLAVAAGMVVHPRRRDLARHFVEAGGMATEMERAGGVHLHAAFAHGPATVAYYVHLLTGRSFSFAAHAKDLYLSSPEVLTAKIAASTFVLACSESAAGELRSIVAAEALATRSLPDEKVILAPHGVDIDRFVPDRRRLEREVPASTLRLLAVGRLVPKKGYGVLLESLAALASRGVDFHCRIVGGGALEDELRGDVSRLGLDERVTMCGSLTQLEIVDEYHRADIFVQASVITSDGDRDGIPNSVLEAMASGLPVVATDVAGIPEVIRDGDTGLLVAPGVSGPLSRSLQSLGGDPQERSRLGDAARRFVVAHHARRTCVEFPAALLLDRLIPDPIASEVLA